MSENKPVRPIRRDELRKFKKIAVVFGSRSFSDATIFDGALWDFVKYWQMTPEDTVFVSGLAKGPDAMVIEWAKKNGFRWMECPAAWDDLEAPGARVKVGPKGNKYNAKAGFDRNVDMANISTHGLGFWDQVSPGTKHMVDACHKQEVKLRMIHL